MTSTDVATRDSAAPLAIQPGQEMWTDKQRAALAVLGIKDATNGDLAVFMHVCQKTGLDPFSRQIYYIKRREMVNGAWADKWTIQVGIDGFRVTRDRVAQRTGYVVEFEDTVWYDKDGGEHTVWLSAEPPAACKVVLVKRQAGPIRTQEPLRFPAVLRTAAYMQTGKDGNLVSQWRTQADHMIEKCCEAFATRRAFPNDLGGIYIEEELHGGQDAGQPAAARPVTRAEVLRATLPPADTPSSERAKREARPPQPASKEALGKLRGLLASLPLAAPGERDAAEADVLAWLGGGQWEATRGQVQMATGQLEDFISAAGGDLERAASDLWQRYRDAHPEAVDG